LKRTLLVASLILLVLILTPVILFVSAFSGNSPVKDRESYASFVTTVKDGFVNSFLVNAGNGGLVLIDAGKDTNALAILSALKERGKSSKDVSAIFLTHGHPDHISGVKAFPSAHVYAMEADVALVEGKVGSAGPMTRLFPPNKLGIKVTDALKDDQVVKIGNRSIRVIAAPGHTPGSAVFIIDGVVFLGDSAGCQYQRRSRSCSFHLFRQPRSESGLAPAPRSKTETHRKRDPGSSSRPYRSGLRPQASFGSGIALKAF